MASLLYFIPDLAAARVSRASELPAPFSEAIGAVVGAASLDSRRCAGPFGGHGLMFQAEPEPGGEPATVDFDAGRQQWLKVVASKPAERERWYAIGFWRDKRPQPEDLARPSMVAGHDVELGDRQRWRMPVVGPLMSTLPQSFRRAEAGGFEPTIRPQFETLFAESQRWVDLLTAGGQYLHGDFFRFAAAALAVNYRVGPDECSGDSLDLIGVEHFRAVMDCCLGFRAILDEEARKKKAQAPPNGGSDSWHGNGD